jgi:hypothetical protein
MGTNRQPIANALSGARQAGTRDEPKARQRQRLAYEELQLLKLHAHGRRTKPAQFLIPRGDKSAKKALHLVSYMEPSAEPIPENDRKNASARPGMAELRGSMPQRKHCKAISSGANHSA